MRGSRIRMGFGMPLSAAPQHRLLGRGKHTVEAAKHGKGQDDAPVFRLLVIPAQQVCDRPDKSRKRLMVHEISLRKTVSVAASVQGQGWIGLLGKMGHWGPLNRSDKQ